MWQTLVKKAHQLGSQLSRLFPRPDPQEPMPRRPRPAPPLPYAPLERLLLTDEVGRTLFEEYQQHRTRVRGDDETGWLLLGLRDQREAVVLATLPAGVEADASLTHVWFNSTAQAVGSRVVRQIDKRLTILGVVHTHPGSMRHPSEGDYRGDSQWVRNLRGKEGVFGIGTADAVPLTDAATPRSYQPRPHVQCWGPLQFSWYALGLDDRAYRPLPVEVVYGPDLARPLHPLWATLEEHGEALERLARQQRDIRFEVLIDEWGPGLIVSLPLAQPGAALRLLLRTKEVRYWVEHPGGREEVHPDPPPAAAGAVVKDDGMPIDRGVYLVLAALAGRVNG